MIYTPIRFIRCRELVLIVATRNESAHIELSCDAQEHATNFQETISDCADTDHNLSLRRCQRKTSQRSAILGNCETFMIMSLMSLKTEVLLLAKARVALALDSRIGWAAQHQVSTPAGSAGALGYVYR